MKLQSKGDVARIAGINHNMLINNLRVKLLHKGWNTYRLKTYDNRYESKIENNAELDDYEYREEQFKNPL